jgi:hypothetical protein
MAFWFLTLPVVMRLGLLILIAGACLDLLYHIAPPGWAMDLERYLGAQGENAHVVTLLGMLVTMFGLPIRRTPAQFAEAAAEGSAPGKQ